MQNIDLFDCIIGWTIRSHEGQEIGSPQIALLSRNVLGAVQSMKLVCQPKLLTQSFLSYPNKNIVAKLWATVYISANTVIQSIVHQLLFRGSIIQGMGTIVNQALLHPGHTEDLENIFKKYYIEVRKHTELIDFFYHSPQNGVDAWDGSTESTIFKNPYSRLLGQELVDLVSSLLANASENINLLRRVMSSSIGFVSSLVQRGERRV